MAGLEGLGLGSMASGLSGNIFWTYTVYGIYLVILGVMGWFLYNLIIYKYHIIVIEKRGERDQIISLDSARKYIDSEGIEKYWLKKNKIALELTDFKFHHYIKGKFFQKQALIYYKFGESSYTPIDLINHTEKVKLVPIEADRGHMVRTMAELDAKFDTREFWDKYGTLIISGIMFAVLLVMLIFVARTMENVSGSLANGIDTLATATSQLNECIVR